MSDSDDGEIFQESPRLKAKWLEEMKIKFPVGCRVRVTSHGDGEPDDDYYGSTGTVADYDIGARGGADGSWPLIGVVLDVPRHGNTRDGFYDDQIERSE